jgi:hypothetical protein
MFMSGEQTRIWKEAVMGYFKVLPRHPPQYTEGNNDHFHSG